jgi:hypothetical protein
MITTIVFIETIGREKEMIIGDRLGYGKWEIDINYYFNNYPRGKIRIARFPNDKSFNPLFHFGYYGDTYMKQLVRKCKSFLIKKKQQKTLFSVLVIKTRLPTSCIKKITFYL